MEDGIETGHGYILEGAYDVNATCGMMNPAFYSLCPYECCQETKGFQVQSVWTAGKDVFTCAELASSLTTKFGAGSVADLTFEELFVCTVVEVRNQCQGLCALFLDQCTVPDFDDDDARAWSATDSEFEVESQLQVLKYPF